jgi:hypothetical protein
VIAGLAKLDEFVTHHSDDFHTENRTAAEEFVELGGFYKADLAGLNGLCGKLE